MKLAYVPHRWKMAVVTLIPKPSRGKRTINDYRPISLLSTISKLCERVMSDRFDQWIFEESLISPYQSGFVKGRQTRDQILRMIQDTQRAFNIKHQVGAIFVDKEKAFDRVWHSGLLCKLHSAKIPEYLGNWIKSYQDRSFLVKIEGELSSIGKIQAGVPQGSVLGPKLFNFFFNDIAKASTKNNGIKIAMFADDLMGWKSSLSPKIIEKELQLFLNEIQAWNSRWRMKLSEKKTVYNFYTQKNKIPELNLTYNQTRLKRDPNPKFLGVELDSKLNFKPYIRSVKEKCYHRTNMLKKLAGFRGGNKIKTKIIVSIYKALVQPVIDYNPFMISGRNEYAIKKLEIIQNKSLRIASRWPLKRSNKEMQQALKIETVAERHLRLSKKYIQIASSSNSIIREEVETYKLAKGVIDGHYNHNRRNKKDTIFSKIIRD